jgi:hypothetical protein
MITKPQSGKAGNWGELRDAFLTVPAQGLAREEIYAMGSLVTKEPSKAILGATSRCSARIDACYHQRQSAAIAYRR